MDEEIKALERNETQDLVPKLEGLQHISYKRVFKIKYKAYGMVDGYKARLWQRDSHKRTTWTMKKH